MSALHSRVVTHSKPVRRYLSPDVICHHNFDSPPVIQVRGRRGRLPRNVVRLDSVPRLRDGVVCELRLPNEGLFIVRIDDVTGSEFAKPGYVAVTAICGRSFQVPDGRLAKRVGVKEEFLFRTIIGGRHDFA